MIAAIQIVTIICVVIFDLTPETVRAPAAPCFGGKTTASHAEQGEDQRP